MSTNSPASAINRAPAPASGAITLLARLVQAAGRRACAAALIGLTIAWLPALAFAQPKFPALTGRVVDGANMLSPATEQRLSQQFADLEAKTGRQVVVATVPDLQGHEIEDYGYQLGRTWGIGREAQDDGAILLVAPKERRVRIEVGYGLEPVLTDALSSVIINSRVIPAFKQGDMEGGVVAGAEALVQQLSLPDEEARANVLAARRPQAQAQGGSAWPAIIGALIVFWVISGMLRGFGRSRRRGSHLWWLLPMILSSGRGGGGGFGGGGFGGGGFSGGGGSFGGGGASGRW